MKSTILDTSFIITCAKQKIDFFRYLEEEGFHILIPKQTISELRGLDETLALNLLKKNKFELISAPGKDADAAIIYIARKNPETIVATLDRELQNKIKNKRLVIRGKKNLEII